MPELPWPRSSGLLLHPTSLPGPYGIGDLGPHAHDWVKTLAAAKQSSWQILPVGLTAAGNSRYQAYSAFAGNIDLLSPELLVRDGLVSPSSISGVSLPDDHVDYPRVATFKNALLREASAGFQNNRGPARLREEFEQYRERQAHWLDDFALFMAARGAFGGKPFVEWPADVLRRQPAALAALQQQLAGEITIQRIGQYLF